MIKKTKIVCTVGSSTDSPGVLSKMITAGMNVARFNFSHGTHEEQTRRIKLVRAAARQAQTPIALMLDTKGPQMRIGKFSSGKVTLTKGSFFVLTAANIVGDETKVAINYKQLPYEINPGTIILLADGLISLKVEKVANEDIITTVLNSGKVSDNQRLAVPGIYLGLPPISTQDIEDIRFGIKQGMDYIAASFIQGADDVLAIRKIIEDAKGQMGIIAKIENMYGVENIDQILKVADGIMVARGDLGVQIPIENVPLAQKMLIDKCNQAGKPVITATQMLESMIVNPRPTRAEASDVANAIIDGTDALMLSDETACGQYPIQAVAIMAKIAMRTEKDLPYRDILHNKGLLLKSTTTDAISHATVQVAHQLAASAIITATESGYTPRMVSKYRPEACIIAITPNEKTARFVQLSWGVYPVVVGISQNFEGLVKNAVLSSLHTGIIQDGDLVVITAGFPAGISGTTNLIRVQVARKLLPRGISIDQRVV